MNEENGEKKTAVITGATKGLGKALATVFARAGYEIVGLYRSDTAAAGALEEEFRAGGLEGTFIRQDITEDGPWNEFDELVERIGANRELTLIANACRPFVPKPFHKTVWPELAEQIEVNVKGTFNVLQRLLPLMARARRGTVISVLTTALDPPAKGFAAYLAAKSALEGLTRSAAAEFSERGIRVISVSPGFMETSLTAGWSEHFKASAFSGSNDASGAPADFAEEILALAESAAVAGRGENYPLGRHKRP